MTSLFFFSIIAFSCEGTSKKEAGLITQKVWLEVGSIRSACARFLGEGEGGGGEAGKVFTTEGTQFLVSLFRGFMGVVLV